MIIINGGTRKQQVDVGKGVLPQVSMPQQQYQQ
jgi:hypothetical protein